jgi:hypothetical protein
MIPGRTPAGEAGACPDGNSKIEAALRTGGSLEQPIGSIVDDNRSITSKHQRQRP